MKRHFCRCLSLSMMMLALVAPHARAAGPETVMVTLHAKPGTEAELARVIERHWETARRLNLVLETPRFTLRGVEDGNKIYFVEVFTWVDAAIPDKAPEPILAIWKEMHALTAARGGQPGLNIMEVSMLAPGAGQRP